MGNVKLLEFGDILLSTVTFSDKAGTPSDPTTVTLKWRSPDGTETTKTDADPEVTSIGSGVYEGQIICNQKGRYFGEWIGSGAVVAQEHFEFIVRGKKVLT